MTRDEAVKLLWLPSPCPNWAVSKKDAENIVDRLAALGVLRLDKPPTTDQRINIAINTAPGREAGDIKDALTRAGFSIVETSALPRPDDRGRP